MDDFFTIFIIANRSIYICVWEFCVPPLLFVSLLI